MPGVDTRLPQHEGAYAAAAVGASEAWKTSVAARAPVMACYEAAVQEPLVECENIDALYANAQADKSDVPEARTLREDFCSTAVIARTWLALRPGVNAAQGVDIDLHALRGTHTLVSTHYPPEAIERIGPSIVQSPAYVGAVPSSDKEEVLGKEWLSGGSTQDLSPSLSSLPLDLSPSLPATPALLPTEAIPSSDSSSGPQTPSRPGSTWDVGVTTDRFERKFQARQAKAKAQALKKAMLEQKHNRDTVLPNPVQGPKQLLLIHSDVQDLPFKYTSATNEVQSIPAPDVVAAMNYGLCYFHTRAELVGYLRMCFRTLRSGTGRLICDLFGGPSNGEQYDPQAPLWTQFQSEPGFIRGGDRKREELAGGDKGVLRPLWDDKPPSYHNQSSDEGQVRIVPASVTERVNDSCGSWPKGRLKLVRKVNAYNGFDFEYWREDSEMDYATNRFRMSLSFRFADHSWLRDVFSYDFRVWTVKEVTEAMEEVGFERVSVHVIARNAQDAYETDSEPPTPSETEHDEDEFLAGLDDMAELLRRTEKEERARCSYRRMANGDKIFATKPFNTYIVACKP